ncbi:hypothetical protein [Legionella bozemanae]|uniref:Uncharacterized protein n=1 Tax=Legionella bozemanae TaxID=447 RepID=A0A0W0S2U9_LEGBO|nr:hypothetical protein [Legionella bozemanae]KTC77772.1 hypothetical protein Lboz_0060 [Legionella bozemanae]STO33931.1 Uncharacterised protein [Legionella bozemanae]STO34381.1 Uncharacterised protein [Legionella bozemanae]
MSKIFSTFCGVDVATDKIIVQLPQDRKSIIGFIKKNFEQPNETPGCPGKY